MSCFYRCDRCGAIIENGIYEFLTMPIRKSNYDLCFSCWNDFKEFMNERGHIHLWKNTKGQ